MAWSAKVGSFALATTTGNQSVTGVGFQPKAIIFLGNHLTADGSVASSGTMYGMGTSSTARGCIWTASLDAQDPTACRRILRTDRIVALFTSTTANAVADLVSLDADGFTINNTTADATNSRIVNYLALGGTDISNVYCGTFTSPASAGSSSITGVGFQPDCVLGMACGTAPNTSPSTGQNCSMFAFTGSANWVSCNRAENGRSDVSSAKGYQRTASCVAVPSTSSETVPIEATLTSMDADGFTLSYSASATVTNGFLFLALKGGSYKVGAINQATSTGDQATTGVGFTPAILFLTSFGAVAATGFQANSRRTIGIGTSVTARGCIWAGETDNQATTICDSDLDRTEIFKSFTPGTPTLESSAELKTLDSDGFTLTWGTADATARQICYLAMGATPAAGGNAVPCKMASYRRRFSA